jgi:DNA-binding IclR family transcriptional regulator
VARDSAPVARVAVLRTMADEDGPLSTSELANRVALPTATAARVADDLVALRLMDCERRGSGKANVYTLTFLGARMWVDAGWL